MAEYIEPIGRRVEPARPQASRPNHHRRSEHVADEGRFCSVARGERQPYSLRSRVEGYPRHGEADEWLNRLYF